MRRCTLRSQKNILKRLLIHVGAFNISLVLRKMLGAGKPRELNNRVADLVLRLIGLLINLCRHYNVDQAFQSGNKPLFGRIVSAAMCGIFNCRPSLGDTADAERRAGALTTPCIVSYSCGN